MASIKTSQWATTCFTRALNIQYPIVQAPCAGHTGADLIASVSNAGGLGSLGAGMIPPPQLRETIQRIREKTDKPFSVNLFCRTTAPPSTQELDQHYPATDDILNEIRVDLGIPIPTEYKLRSPSFDDQVQVLLEEQVPVVSFTFGLLPEEASEQFRKAGTYLIGTATTVQEALVLAGLADPKDSTRKADAIVAQGLEAGGHRGSFLSGSGPYHEQKSTAQLVQAIRSASKDYPLPILAAGGITTGDDLYTALHDWKADGAVLGTLFMLATESSTPKAHKDYLLTTAKNSESKITRTLTGRRVRAYPNKLMQRIEERAGQEEMIPPYDVQSSKTKDIVAYATSHGIQDYMALLSGVNAPVAATYTNHGTLSAADILNKLVADVNKKVAN
ncbi:hypothetical protein INT47_006289 [Mucor saturninus]|uniref:2-nitropropane dioxygenase n=1 Tax=Mucor saturninus TaxID=64648 RepID=A0A8H7RIR7_9FUNG|nr:hypothetical protein INT47_006289 [Mucor saturninus]